jgi:hypothetical protein
MATNQRPVAAASGQAVPSRALRRNVMLVPHIAVDASHPGGAMPGFLSQLTLAVDVGLYVVMVLASAYLIHYAARARE